MQSFERLEVEWAEVVKAEHAVACASGTAALHLALEAFRFPAGSEVIVPEFTMVACARAVVMAGLKPVFVDCNDSLLMEADQCSRLITQNTRAIMPVHIYGRGCEMFPIWELARKHDLKIIEDCAEFHGAGLSGLADAYCWSFYRNKIVAGEEGGIIVFQDKEPAQYAKLLRCQGFTKTHDFSHVPRGVNARLANTLAELILQSLSKLSAELLRRREFSLLCDRYLPAHWLMPDRDVVWVYDIRIPNRKVGPIVSVLNSCGIAARHAFKPMSMQSEFAAPYLSLNAHQMSNEVFYLPVSSTIDSLEIQSIIQMIISLEKTL